jgi:hypothetical protein
MLDGRRRRAVLGMAVIALLLAGCGGGGNDKAQREYKACTQQADEIATTQGAAAGSAHLKHCTEDLANGATVEP